MVEKVNDGGQAFPCIARWQSIGNPEVFKVIESAGGMSLRDWFAGQAMAAMIESSVHSETFSDFHYGSAQVYATKAYIMADAMLKAREVPDAK